MALMEAEMQVNALWCSARKAVALFMMTAAENLLEAAADEAQALEVLREADEGTRVSGTSAPVASAP
eukprot:CAMPEP_0180498032 /NCGR_PEP_ID=MMETSP1036_2-20121128/43112_1 /TAXON_ID=632150 /ORGANISM="Azadinium spinosum, Strain 3D9" /LENGTH=66 /DNA_ID=CAMNT_0022506625 /DNA_START=49 /DNA_END=245 /DNA_ORIENTATION=-